MKLVMKADGRTDAGGSPLICHNERLADPLDPFTRAIQSIAKKRSKQEADHLEIGHLEFLGGLYTDPPIETPDDQDGQSIGIPSWNLIRCLQDGATRQRKGRDVLRGIHPLDTFAQLDYPGPTDLEGVWREKLWIRKTVGVQKSRMVRTRPMFTEWRIELPIEVDEILWDLDKLELAWMDAGRYEGLGEMRPIYGRFLGTIEALEPVAVAKTEKVKAAA
jgi:hypothetical protein